MKIAVDSNALTYLIDVINPAYDPKLDKSGLSDDRISMLRIFFYGGYTYYILPTVFDEFKRIEDALKRNSHESFCQVLTEHGIWDFNQHNIKKRIRELLPYHNKMKDCQIVAEAEMGGLDTLLTRDKDFLTHLGLKTNVSLQSPYQFWESLSIMPGTERKLSPHPTNPLANKSWWIW